MPRPNVIRQSQQVHNPIPTSYSGDLRDRPDLRTAERGLREQPPHHSGYTAPQEGYLSESQRGEDYDNPPPQFPEWKAIYNLFPNKWKALVTKWETEYNYWLLENERAYDSPANQVDLLQEGGLSTALMYGSGGSAGVGQSGKGAGKQMDTSNIMQGPLDMINTISGFKQTMANIKNINADTYKKQVEAQDTYAELSAKDQRFFDPKTGLGASPTEEQINSMSPREKKHYMESQKAIGSARQALESAKTQKERTKYQTLLNQLMEKQLNWFITNQISSLATAGAGIGLKVSGMSK